MKSHVDHLQTLAKRSGVIRAKEAAAAGVPREYLPRLAAKGLLVRVGRGLYVLPGTEGWAQHTLAEVAKAVPRSVVCLLTALRFHELTTQNPSEIWLAVPNKARRPRQIAWKIEVVYMGGAAFRAIAKLAMVSARSPAECDANLVAALRPGHHP